MESIEYQNKEKELIECILGIRNNHSQRQSTLQLALRNAKLNESIDNNFACLLFYLIALEQIGNLFCKSNSYNNEIIKALETFSDIKFDKCELQGIKHLRHSLAHNYSLAIVDKNKCYKFILCYY